MKLKIYTHAEYGDCYLSRNVLDALESPRHVRQGRVYVWALTAKAAAEYLTAVGLPIASRKLRLAGDNDAVALDGAFPWPEGTVLVTRMTGGAVVELSLATKGGSLEQSVRRLGELVSGTRFRPVDDFSTDVEPEVTENMLNAATNALSGRVINRPNILSSSELRGVILAALRAQQESRS
jgi:hypothetical protein